MSALARALLTLAVLSGALPAPAHAQQLAGVFSQGRTHFYLSGGAGSSFGQSYVVIGAGLEYYLLNGLGAGLAFESWSGADPGFTTITPSVRYVFYDVRSVKPYVGAFYRRTDFGNGQSLDSAGARAGVFVQTGGKAYMGFGVTYESYLDCQPAVYDTCSSTYPELSFGVVF
jgi:hypothetical protein